MDNVELRRDMGASDVHRGLLRKQTNKKTQKKKEKENEKVKENEKKKEWEC